MVDFETKCIICGETLEKAEDKVSCPKCHFEEQNQVSKTDMTMLSEAFLCLENKDFDKAYDGFFKFVKKHTDLSVGYFGLVLSKYYVTSFSLENVEVASVKNNCVLNDVDYMSAVKYAHGELRDYIMAVAKLIEEKSVNVVSSALEYKPYEIAVLNDKEGEVYSYLDKLGYDTYSDNLDSNNDYLVEEFNVKSNVKMLVVNIDSLESLESLSNNIVIKEYVSSLNLKNVKDGSFVIVAKGNTKDIKKMFPEATILDGDKKTLLFDIESVAKTAVREIVAPKDSVKVKDNTNNTSFNVKGFSSLVRGLGIAGLAILLIEFVLYTFFGAHYLVLSIGLGFAGALMIATCALSVVVYLKANHGLLYMMTLIISGVFVITCVVGMCSVFLSNGGSEWCYQGYWYKDNDNDTVSVTNVDYYYTFFNRDVKIPDKIMGKAVTHFNLQNHAEVFGLTSVSENLQELVVTNCDNLREILISVMSFEENTVVITGCDKLETISIKNADVIKKLELKDLVSLDNVILKGIKEIKACTLYNITVDEIWLPEELTRLTNLSMDGIDSMYIYMLNSHEANIRPALTRETYFEGNGYKHPNDPDTTSNTYSRYVYPRVVN